MQQSDDFRDLQACTKQHDAVLLVVSSTALMRWVQHDAVDQQTGSRRHCLSMNRVDRALQGETNGIWVVIDSFDRLYYVAATDVCAPAGSALSMKPVQLGFLLFALWDSLSKMVAQSDRLHAGLDHIHSRG